jgi:hypothetical protein
LSGSASCLFVYPDTNVLIQGIPLKDVPWSELGRDEIEVVICGPVIREVDRLKNKPGRVGKVARAISATVRKLMAAPDRSDVLRAADPVVRRRLSRDTTGGAAVRSGLDLTHDDQAIINQALARLDAGEDVILLTDDTFAAMTAEDFSLPVRMLPVHWLKPPEGDESAKEVTRLQAENALLKATQPVPKLRFIDEHDAPIDRLDLVMKRYPPVANREIERLMGHVLAAAPMADLSLTAAAARDPDYLEPATGPSLIASAMREVMKDHMQPVTKADIDAYAKAYKAWRSDVRAKLVGFGDEWSRRRDWPRAKLFALNAGTCPAENMLVEIAASGAFQVSGYPKDEDDGDGSSRPRLNLSLPEPPEPPRAKHRMAEFLKTFAGRDVPAIRPFRSIGDLSNRRQDDAFYWREGKRSPVDTLSLECKTWRHGRNEKPFRFRIWGDDAEDISGVVTARVSAGNLLKPVEARLPVRIRFEDGDSLRLVEQLVEMFERQRGVIRER